MQSADSRDKITILILLAASTMIGVLAHGFGPIALSADAAPGDGVPVPNRLFTALALAGSLIAVLMLLSPGRNHRSLGATVRDSWPQLAGLSLLVVGYALALGTLGFFLATSLFLALGYLLLGGRRWEALLVLALPVAAVFELMMHGMFGVAVADPWLGTIGLFA
ncbi:MAG: tripartite tricarboxylate transporter TctB family protein [Geminicoccaceae bacterium]